MNEFLEQFLIESREFAEQATHGLLALERSPRDAGQLDAVFRALHTLKGGAGIVDFFAMERALHGAEDLLSAARAGRRVLDAGMVGDCLACVDQVLQWLDTIERTGELPPPPTCEAEADRIAARFGATLHEVKQDPVAQPAAGFPPHAREVLAAQLALVSEPTATGSFGRLASAAVTASRVLSFCGRGGEAEHMTQLVIPDVDAMQSSLQAALARLLAEEVPAVAAAEAPAASPRTEATARTLRIDAERIDALVRLTGELTVAKNALAHLVKLAHADANPMAAALQARQAVFEHLTRDLQRQVLTLRVLPIRVLFQRFPRLVREMSESLGKPATLQLAGEDTEADKAIVEMLFEPLLHVVRNAMDHGVEGATLRAERGKPREATIGMRAARQGDQVVIEVTDDGAGMDAGRIREVAAQRGVAATEVLATMAEAEIFDLVFAPGFSTAAAVTSLSGRGVGMDAVRTAIERTGGRVSIDSVAGRGTTVRLTLPFSVMMTTIMSVQAGGQMFGVPLDNVVETIRVPRTRLAAVGMARAVVVREQTIPVVDLAQMLGEAGRAHDGSDATIVIAAFGGQRCGLDVDALGERLDVILKPLDGLLAGTPGITGTTLLGDGRVLLVLDIAALLQ